MENENVDSTTNTRSKLQTLIRQNSEKLGEFAEAAVLPKNQRSFHQITLPEEPTERDVESQSACLPTLTVANNTPQRQKKHFPIFMISISVIQVLLMYTVDHDVLVIIFGYDPHRRYELWRFITIMLVHTGMSHVWSNVIFQLILGVLLEIVHNWKRIAIIYLSSILGGTLFISVLDPESYAVGASAGVYGLLFSHLSTIIINWNEMDRKCCRLFWLLFYVIFDIGLSLYVELMAKTTSRTSHAGHLGGAITGFLVSIIVLKNFEKLPWEEKMQKICAGIVMGLAVVICMINLTAWGHYTPTEWNFDYANTYEKYILRLIVESDELSDIRRECEADLDCRQLLGQYKFNGTIGSI